MNLATNFFLSPLSLQTTTADPETAESAASVAAQATGTSAGVDGNSGGNNGIESDGTAGTDNSSSALVLRSAVALIGLMGGVTLLF